MSYVPIFAIKCKEPTDDVHVFDIISDTKNKQEPTKNNWIWILLYIFNLALKCFRLRTRFHEKKFEVKTLENKLTVHLNNSYWQSNKLCRSFDISNSNSNFIWEPDSLSSVWWRGTCGNFLSVNNWKIETDENGNSRYTVVHGYYAYQHSTNFEIT